jgi:thiamine-phosphate pyrophosphorylase
MASRPKQAEPRPAPRLYLVTPPVADAAAFAPQLTTALESTEIAAVLLRLVASDERTLINRIKNFAPVVQNRGAALLVDGHADLAARGGADGAHLTGIEAFNASLERLKPERIAGVGGLATRHDVMIAAEAGADYVMFGGPEIEPAATVDRVRWCAELFELPCVAFARAVSEIEPLVAAGADFVALDFVWMERSGLAQALDDASARLRLPELAR